MIGIILCVSCVNAPDSKAIAEQINLSQKKLETCFRSKDRMQKVRASFDMVEAHCSIIKERTADRWCDNVTPGKLLVVDETILLDVSRRAILKNMIRYIPGKPVPKGLFINGALQRFHKSQAVYALDLEYKWCADSVGMGDALLALVVRCERRTTATFVVLADSGYPSSRILLEPHPEIQSTFICSVSVANVSGSLRFMPQAISDHCPMEHQFCLNMKILNLRPTCIVARITHSVSLQMSSLALQNRRLSRLLRGFHMSKP